MMITRQVLRDWGACWRDERIDAWFGTRQEVTPREVAHDTQISFPDRAWVLGRAVDHVKGLAGTKALARALAYQAAGHYADKNAYLDWFHTIVRAADSDVGAERLFDLRSDALRLYPGAPLGYCTYNEIGPAVWEAICAFARDPHNHDWGLSYYRYVADALTISLSHLGIEAYQ